MRWQQQLRHFRRAAPQAAQPHRQLPSCTDACALPPRPHPAPPLAELGAVDEGLRRRMLDMFRPAGEPVAPPSGSAAILGGGGGGQAPLPSLHAVIVELDGRFITEITHTAALFAELFPPGGRKRLVKVRQGPGAAEGRAGRWGGRAAAREGGRRTLPSMHWCLPTALGGCIA